LIREKQLNLKLVVKICCFQYSTNIAKNVYVNHHYLKKLSYFSRINISIKTMPMETTGKKLNYLKMLYIKRDRGHTPEGTVERNYSSVCQKKEPLVM